MECSNNGVCDRSSGLCKCRSGFEGSACERMKCGGTPTCSGRGRCLPIYQLAYQTDAMPLVTDSYKYNFKKAYNVNGTHSLTLHILTHSPNLLLTQVLIGTPRLNSSRVRTAIARWVGTTSSAIPACVTPAGPLG